MAELKVVICGGRDFYGSEVFTEFVDDCLAEIKKDHKITVLSGHCSGVDTMAEEYAKANGYEVRIFPAEWARYGKVAGPKRNLQMANEADTVIAFWNGSSRGTGNMIETAKKLKKAVYVRMI